MAKKPEKVSVLVSGLTGVVVGADELSGRVYADLSAKPGDTDTANDLLYGCLYIRDQRGALEAVRALLDDETRLAQFVQEYFARKTGAV
jgi:hypothetical protein